MSEPKQAKFTKGPWEIVRVHFVPIGIGTRQQSSGKGVHCFRMIGNTLEPGDDEPDLEEIEANANLIGASKDLYFALKKAVDQYGKPGGPWNVPDEPGSWIAEARAALKKAVGE